jgi:hypothetical protein
VEIKVVVVAQVQATLAAAAARAKLAHAADKVECNFTESMINAETKNCETKSLPHFSANDWMKIIRVPLHAGLISLTSNQLS